MLIALLASCTKNLYTDSTLADDLHGNVLRTITYSYYDDLWQKSWYMAFDTTGALLEDWYYYYDRAFRDPKTGDIYSRATYTRDDKGRIVRSEYYNHDERWELCRQYDKLGRLVAENKNSLAGADGYTHIRYYYDDRTNHRICRVEEISDPDNEEYTLRKDSFVYTITQTDSRDNWLRREWTDYIAKTSFGGYYASTITESTIEGLDVRFIQYADEADAMKSLEVETESRSLHDYYRDWQNYVDYSLEWDEPVSISSGDIKKLRAALSKFVLDRAESGRTIEDRMATVGFEHYTSMPKNRDAEYGLLKTKQTLRMVRACGDLITYELKTTTQGGEDDSYYPHYFNFDTRSNEVINFSDLLMDYDYYQSVANMLGNTAAEQGQEWPQTGEFYGADFYLDGTDIVYHSFNTNDSGIRMHIGNLFRFMSNRGRRFMTPFALRTLEKPISEHTNAIPLSELD